MDLIITNNNQSIINKSVFNPHLSDHAYTECIISTKKPVPIKKQKHRNYNNINHTDLATYINNIEASQGDVETVTHGVINDILAIYDILAPIRTVT